MKSVSGKQFARILERHEWTLVRVRGSHHIYARIGEPRRAAVPIHGNRPLKEGLQRRLMRLAGIGEDEL